MLHLTNGYIWIDRGKRSYDATQKKYFELKAEAKNAMRKTKYKIKVKVPVIGEYIYAETVMAKDSEDAKIQAITRAHREEKPWQQDLNLDWDHASTSEMKAETQSQDVWDKIVPLMGKISDRKLAKMLNVSPMTIQRKRLDLGKKSAQKHTKIDWTLWDDQLGNILDKDLAHKIGCHVSTVAGRRREKNIPLKL
jgi:hypothetical protein